MQLWEQVTALPWDVSPKFTCNPQFNLKLYLNKQWYFKRLEVCPVSGSSQSQSLMRSPAHKQQVDATFFCAACNSEGWK